MATKLFKRTNSRDVFDEVVEDAQDERDIDGVETHTGGGDSISGDTSVDDVDVVSEDTSEDDTDDANADGAEASRPVPSRRKRWIRYTLAAVAALVFVAALALSGYLGWQYKQQKDIENASRAALSAAQHFAATLTSIDTNSVDKNFHDVTDGSTGEFKDMYSQSASQLRQVLIDNKAMSKGTVIDSAVKSATKDKVEVALFVDQWITNNASPQPRLDRSRVAMTMQLVDGRWLASSVELK